MRSGLRPATWGLLAAALLSGCSAAAVSSPAVSSPAAPAPTAGQWSAALGPHTVVVPPTASPADGSPQWVVLNYTRHLVSRRSGSACSFLVTAARAYCEQGYRENVKQGIGISYAYRSFQIGYAVIYDGNKALVDTTRAGLCSQPVTANCVADNSDPAALFDDGQSFATLWHSAHHVDSYGYVPTPLVRTGGHWYIDTAAILGG